MQPLIYLSCPVGELITAVSSGCDTAWAETREGSFTFTCKGCKRVEFLVRELAELREMLVGMKRVVTGHGLEGKE